MKLSNKNITNLALFNGIANVITLIAVICFIISLIMILISGFHGAFKNIFILSIIGMVLFWTIAQSCKFLIGKSENDL